MSSTRVILIIGAGPRIGRAVASKFASNGYKVAMAARSLVEGLSTEDYLNIKIDLADPGCLLSMFQTVEKVLGLPNIVVFNGSSISIYSLVL
jgi:NAD(P)-dependent dehydrogenase (short-subunit alcohol dehydrogenase family)